MADLRESRSIEQGADVIIFVFREEVYKPDEPELSGVANIIVSKQRDGPKGRVKLTFLKDCTRFEDGADELRVVGSGLLQLVPPDYPVLWVTDARKTAPFAGTLRICVSIGG